MKRYKITLFKQFEKVSFYTVHEYNQRLSETDLFFSRFKDDSNYVTDIQVIKYWLEKIGNEYGAQERHFRPEKLASAIPIPPPQSKLRLYCYHVNEQIVILGNGGIKLSKKAQGSPETKPHFDLANDLAYLFALKINNGKIKIKGDTLSGDLTFFIK